MNDTVLVSNAFLQLEKTCMVTPTLCCYLCTNLFEPLIYLSLCDYNLVLLRWTPSLFFLWISNMEFDFYLPVIFVALCVVSPNYYDKSLYLENEQNCMLKIYKLVPLSIVLHDLYFFFILIKSTPRLIVHEHSQSLLTTFCIFNESISTLSGSIPFHTKYSNLPQ